MFMTECLRVYYTGTFLLVNPDAIKSGNFLDIILFNFVLGIVSLLNC